MIRLVFLALLAMFFCGGDWRHPDLFLPIPLAHADFEQLLPPQDIFINGVADGVTDNTAAINTAYQAAIASNALSARVRFPSCGQFAFSGNFHFTKEFDLLGKGMNCTSLKFTGTGVGIWLDMDRGSSWWNSGGWPRMIIEELDYQGTAYTNGTGLHCESQIAFLIGGNSSSSAGVGIEINRVTTHKFCLGLVFGSNAYDSTVHDSQFGENYMNIVFPGYTVPASAAWTTSNNTISLTSTLPFYLVAGGLYNVTDTSNGYQSVGTVSAGANSKTLTLAANALIASTGGADNLLIAPTNAGENIRFYNNDYSASGVTYGSNTTVPATASWAAGATTISATVPAWVHNGDNVYSTTKNSWIGIIDTIANAGTSFNLAQGAFAASSGTTDTLQINHPGMILQQELSFEMGSINGNSILVPHNASGHVRIHNMHLETPGTTQQYPFISYLGGNIIDLEADEFDFNNGAHTPPIWGWWGQLDGKSVYVFGDSSPQFYYLTNGAKLNTFGGNYNNVTVIEATATGWSGTYNHYP